MTFLLILNFILLIVNIFLFKQYYNYIKLDKLIWKTFNNRKIIILEQGDNNAIKKR